MADALDKGAQLKCGGSSHGALNNFFEPSVLTGITQKMELWQNEVFGPVVSVTSFKDEAEVIALANDSKVGLAAYVFSTDNDRKARVANELEVGMIGINTGTISSSKIPFGGVKESGFGREGSMYGLGEYVSLKYICSTKL